MEPYIKNNANDVTYISKLTRTPSQYKKMAMVFWVWGLIRTITYSHLRVRKLCAH